MGTTVAGQGWAAVPTWFCHRTAAFGRGWWPRGRIAGLGRQRQLSPEEEEKTLEGIEHERAEFFRHHFHVDTGDTTRHDVTVDVDRYTLPRAVELIL